MSASNEVNAEIKKWLMEKGLPEAMAYTPLDRLLIKLRITSRPLVFESLPRRLFVFFMYNIGVGSFFSWGLIKFWFGKDPLEYQSTFLLILGTLILGGLIVELFQHRRIHKHSQPKRFSDFNY